MVDLPHADDRFAGTISPSVADSTPIKPSITYPPTGAPNVVVVLLDDVGFGAAATFGGPIPTPALDRVARNGLRYNQFHTTALCSPTRAALLTGRNHHSAHMGTICEIAYGFPGYDSVLPQSTATVAQILRMNGYSTALFGKAHLTPTWEIGPAGPFDRWPTGLGFERFYGFLGGDTSQYEPAVYDQTTPVEPYLGRDDYHLTEDLADKAIEWIRTQKTSAPDKPFFVYFAPGATHSPHHVWPEWSDEFAGEFDDGWDALRERIYARQIEMGIIPPGARLTPRPEQIPAWADYDDRYKPVARRLMEVYAGFLAHTDAQIGRVIAAIDELGQWDDTLFIYVCGDNGASAEGTLHGAWSSPAFQNGLPEDPEWLLAHLADFGTARCENHYNVGWAWALDAPFQWMKQVASHFGGTRNGLAISWPRGIGAVGEQRSQFHHVIDIVPTILDAVGIAAPARVNGVEQKPIEGVSMRYSFDDPHADSRRTTQYFEIFGNRAVYHEGWIASCFHGRLPWIRTQRPNPFGDAERWELYRLADDFSQGVDLAEQCPDKLAELKTVFDAEARKYDVYPLSDAILARALPGNRPSLLGRAHLGHLLRRPGPHPRTGDAVLHQHILRASGAAADPAGRGTRRGHLYRRFDGRVDALPAGRHPALRLQLPGSRAHHNCGTRSPAGRPCRPWSFVRLRRWGTGQGRVGVAARQRRRGGQRPPGADGSVPVLDERRNAGRRGRHRLTGRAVRTRFPVHRSYRPDRRDRSPAAGRSRRGDRRG